MLRQALAFQNILSPQATKLILNWLVNIEVKAVLANLVNPSMQIQFN